jgi:hypothetical protein
MQNPQDYPEKKTVIPSDLDELLAQKLNETEALKRLLSKLETMDDRNFKKETDIEIK